MQTRLMGKTGENVSLLGFGCMRFPEKNNVIDQEKVNEMVDYAYKKGVNYFDTAYVYGDGKSEKAIGEALKKYPRESFYLADKLPLWCVNKKADMEKILDTSLERLGTDYIDFYLVHAMDNTRIEPLKKFEVIEFLKDMKKKGKIRHIGFSFHDSPDVLNEILDLYDWEFVQLQLNYLDWKAFKAEDLHDALAKRNIPCVVMEPIRGGNLANPPEAVKEIFTKANNKMTPAAWALNFVASQKQVRVILSGMSAFPQVKENIETLGNFKPLTGKELDALNEAVNYLGTLPTILCTGCEYCLPCPKKVKIPVVFRTYNGYITLENKEMFKNGVEKNLSEGGPEDCVKCGLCKTKCPQHLDIPNLLTRYLDLRKKLSI